MSSTSVLLVLIGRLLWEAKSYDELNSQLTIMSKKHGQLKEAVVRMVDEAMTWLPELKRRKDEGEFKGGKDRWLELVNTLRDITGGKVSRLHRSRNALTDDKIYLELARARLTNMLASYYETLAESAPESSSESAV